MKFSIKDFFTCGFDQFTEEILNRKLHFLCSVNWKILELKNYSEAEVEVYSEPCQTSTMELFTKIIDGFQTSAMRNNLDLSNSVS